jgi:hypothetical protein
MTFKLGSVNKQFNSETESFKRTFKLRHRLDPIFRKEFDGGSTSAVIAGSDSIVINNHFFVTGEKLQYTAEAGNEPIGIDHGVNGVGAATTLPSEVFAIKVNENTFKVAATKALALTADSIGIATVGIGSTHTFQAIKQNTKCIISVDNIIQSPMYQKHGATTTVDSISNKNVVLTDGSIFERFDLFKINDEVMRIRLTNVDGNPNKFIIDRAWMGTKKQTHSSGDTVQFMLGDYNIIDNEITFVDVPFGGNRRTVGISSNDISISSNYFTSLTDDLDTGTQVKLRSLNPPEPLESNRDYYIIKNAANNFSFAETKDAALVGNKLLLISAGIGTHSLVNADIQVGSSFQGRVFQRSDYDGNVIFDDLADQFTGIGKTFTLKKDNTNVSGITTDFGAILINNIFQKPDVDYEFISSPNPGITSVAFKGNDQPGFIANTNPNDVNANRLPRKGIVVSFGNTQGIGYVPGAYDDIALVSSNTGIGVSVRVTVGTGKSVGQIDIVNPGYGYTVGELLQVVGIPTISTYGLDFTPATATVLDTFDDEFAGWVFGKLEILDNFSDQFDGRRSVFQITKNNVPMSIEKRDGSVVELDQVLLIFINDVLQKPGKAYVFEGGTRIRFTEPPRTGSSLQFLFYRGTDADITTAEDFPDVKKGDNLTLGKQDSRVMRDVFSRDTVLTTNYKGPYITDAAIPTRVIDLCKQTEDKFVEGVKVPKSRPSLGARIFPAARVIRNVAALDTEVYLNSGSLIFSLTEGNTYNPQEDWPMLLVDNEVNPVGYGTTGFKVERVEKNVANIVGDSGYVCGVGSTDQGMQMHFHISLNDAQRQNQYGGKLKTGIGTGDYFIISKSNVGSGLTSLSKDRTATVGTAVTCIDGIYECSHIEDLASDVVKVHVNIVSGHGLDFTGLHSDVGTHYAEFSWAKVTANSSIGTTFTINTTGLTGITTAPTLIREQKLLVDYP